MAQKKPARTTTKKANPSKPPKGTGGGGAASDGSASLNMDSGVENYSALPLAKQTNSSREKFSPLGDLAEYEALRRMAYQKAAALSDNDRAMDRARGKPEEEIAKEASLYAECEAEEAEVEAFEEHFLNRIARGEIFNKNPCALVRAVIHRIKMEIASAERDADGKSSAAEWYLAELVSEVIRSRSVNPKMVWPWIAKSLKSPGFQSEWSFLRRKCNKPHERVMFEMCISRIAAVDDWLLAMMKESGLNASRTAEQVHAAVEAILARIAAEQTSPAKWAIIRAVVLRYLDFWSPLKPEIEASFGDTWSRWKKREPLEVAELIIPYLMEEWSEFKKQNKSVQKRGCIAPSAVRRAIANCAKTIYTDNARYDHVTMPREKQLWFIEKHT